MPNIIFRWNVPPRQRLRSFHLGNTSNPRLFVCWCKSPAGFDQWSLFRAPDPSIPLQTAPKHQNTLSKAPPPTFTVYCSLKPTLSLFGAGKLTLPPLFPYLLQTRGIFTASLTVTTSKNKQTSTWRRQNRSRHGLRIWAFPMVQEIDVGRGFNRSLDDPICSGFTGVTVLDVTRESSENIKAKKHRFGLV